MLLDLIKYDVIVVINNFGFDNLKFDEIGLHGMNNSPSIPFDN